MNGPVDELLAATWNVSDVFAGTVAVHDRVDQIGVDPVDGLASLIAETKSPEVAKAVFTYVRKPRSLAAPIQVAPLSADVTLRPFPYAFAELNVSA